MRPGSNTPGALPTDVLLGSERVVYEAHPGPLRLHPVMFWAPLPFLVFFLLLIAVEESSPASAVSVPVLVVIVLVFVLPFLLIMLRAVTSARRTTYGLTDQRVILRVGDESVSVPYTQIQGVASAGKSNVVFSVRADAQIARSPLLKAGGASLTWKAVTGSQAVSAYARSAWQYYTLRMQQAMIRQDLIKASIEDKIFCQYCGGFTVLSRIDVNNPRCPRCAAPIVVAPIGVY